MNQQSNCIFACNKILRGEISAIESYRVALEKFENSHHRELLQSIADDHRKSTEALRDHISSMGAVPDTDSGAWGSFAQTVTGTAGLLGQGSALAALIQGEEHGVGEYEAALADPDVMDEVKDVFRDTLLPRLRKHITTLESIKS